MKMEKHQRYIVLWNKMELELYVYYVKHSIHIYTYVINKIPKKLY